MIKLNSFEKEIVPKVKEEHKKLTDDLINVKYEKGENRIVTELGSIKLSLISGTFTQKNYELKPNYQRRITWDERKRSKLIESFIMNVPVPPVFIYETEFNKYQVMDGLQRITAIIDFYNDKYELKGLEQWSELNGRTYSSLPQKVREGIDRRQISVVTLLKESSKTVEQEEEMKKMVFERLNTGGVKLVDQEIRNALYSGNFNDLCIDLSADKIFKTLWNINISNESMEDIDIDDDFITDNSLEFTQNFLYRRMSDVEIVLRYFAMRHVEEYNINLSKFLDYCLRAGNEYSEKELQILKNEFLNIIKKCYIIFGEKAFCQYTTIRGKQQWSAPQKMIYDCMMLALTQIELNDDNKLDVKANTEKLKLFYLKNQDSFNGKKQSKQDIITRTELLTKFINEEIGLQK